MINLNVDTRIFNKSYRRFINDQRQTQIFFGGSSSGKSYFILGQRTIFDILAGGRNFLIVRNVARTNRDSTFNEIVKGINKFGLHKEFAINKTDMNITCKNGYQIIFKGLDDIEKVKSITPAKGVLTDIIIEEATECARDKVKQLRKRLRGRSVRTKRMILMFNPVHRNHWIYKDYFAGKFKDYDSIYEDDRLLILKTTYKDNLRFLAADEIYDLENEESEYFKSVYTYGNWGVLGDLIFTNWKIADLSELKNCTAKYRNGLDFGFASDPHALSRSFKQGNQIFVTDSPIEIYQTNVYPDALAESVIKCVGSELVYCDSSQPMLIGQLKQLGVSATKAKKPAGSVVSGINWLQGKEIIVDKDLQHVINELSLYQWKKDSNGDSIGDPVDKENHFLDAFRYSYALEMVARGTRTGDVKGL